MLQSKEPMVMRTCECKWKFWLWGVERKWGNQNLLSRVNLKTKEISFWLVKKKKVYCKKRINKCLVEPYSGSTSYLRTSWQEYRRFISRICKKQLYEYFFHFIKKLHICIAFEKESQTVNGCLFKYGRRPLHSLKANVIIQLARLL